MFQKCLRWFQSVFKENQLKEMDMDFNIIF